MPGSRIAWTPPARPLAGVVVTNGAGSPRTGSYAHLSDAEMQGVRRDEQREAARIGRYAIQLQLAHPSAVVKTPGDAGVAADLAAIFEGCNPDVVYLHSPADKHDTHVAVLLRCLEAIRARPVARRPRQVLACEVWRDLDWMVDTDKVALDSGRHPALALDLLKVFDSQVTWRQTLRPRHARPALGQRGRSIRPTATDQVQRHHVGDGPHAAGERYRARYSGVHAGACGPAAGRH